ncbi:MAG: 50S ribosomal protein L22 [Patescibacteria group bacterium]|nr:50S ribosomal protein L22 [Patescibacteria group bacterium]
MEVKAIARNVRISPRKVRLVVDLVRGLDVKAALAQLKHYPKAAARPVAKLIESAVANASHNFKMETENLYVKTIQADAGPTIKRWRGRAFGRAAPIRKRSSHITVALAVRGAEPAVELKSALVKSAAKAAPAKEEKAPAKKKPAEKKTKSSAKTAPAKGGSASGGKGGTAARKPVKKQ